VIGSIINCISLLNATKILNAIGSYTYMLIAITLELISTIVLSFSHDPLWVGLWFIIHMASISLILYNLDVLVEGASSDESLTGSIRASYLTVTNTLLVIAPSLMAYILLGRTYVAVYTVSALCLIPIYFLILRLRKVKTKPLPHIHVRETIATYTENPDLYNVFACQFLLQFFYACMGIYMPLYLNKIIGFSFSEIGIIFTIMLLPFILFELPVGRMEDTGYTEKEFLITGFIIIGISTLCISFITAHNMLFWAIILFITRTGASFVEISSDSYFFKRVDGESAGVIGMYRMALPLAFIVAPIMIGIYLQFAPFQYVFILLGSSIIIGSKYAIALKNTVNRDVQEFS
jgi:MFS family permease